MKKFLSLVLAVVMVLSMAVTALAVNVQNAKSETVATPNALNAAYAAGILKGEGDKAPSSGDKLTRWQMALIALRLYTLVDSDGLKAYDLDDENWANYVVDFGDKEVKYEDCEYPSALGAILFVQEKGFILGYSEDDRTYFRPAQPVTYAEALTIMVRILGWDSPAMNTNWPYNYVEQAAKLGLTAGISKVGMDDQVTYGTLAQLIYNALNSKRYLPAALTEEFGTVLDAIGADKALAELASALLIFGYLDEDGEFVQITDKAYHSSFTLVKKVGKIGNYLFDSNDKGGYEFDLGEISAPNMDGYLTKNESYELWITDDINVTEVHSNSSDYRVRNWFWFTYEFDFDDEGNVVLDESTRKAALTNNQTRNKDYSANAWFMQASPDHNIAMVYEPMSKNDERLLVISVNGDFYLAHVEKDDQKAYEKAYDEAYDEAYEAKLEEVLADKAIVAELKTAANVYFRAGVIYGGGGFAGDPFKSFTDDDGPYFWEEQGTAHVNNWSVNALLDKLGYSEMMITKEENADLQKVAAAADKPEGFANWDKAWEDPSYGDMDGWATGSEANVLKFFTIGNDWSNYNFEYFSELAGMYDWAIEKYMSQFEAEFDAAGAKAGAKAFQNTLKAALAAVSTDVEGKEFLGWSALREFDKIDMLFGDEEEEKSVKCYFINALYENDSTTFTWNGEENALGSYVTKTVVKDGFTTSEDLAHGLFAMDEIDATLISASAKLIGTCNGATYGAWCIDTDADGLFDVVVYCNFVAPVVEAAE